MDEIEKLGLGEIRNLDVKGRNILYSSRGNSGWRFGTLLTKEPETIEWIDSFAPDETMWDVGANVGIYTVYAALRGIQVVAFEPNFANYFQLCANIMLNGLQDLVLPLCLALDDKKSVSTINLSSLDVGGSNSTFGSDLNFRGHKYKPVFRQGMVGYDIDSLVSDFNLPIPNHFKIDVDSIELPIVRGGLKTFANPTVKSVSIELVETDKSQVSGVTDALSSCGMNFVHWKHAPAAMVKHFEDVHNYLFRRA